MMSTNGGIRKIDVYFSLSGFLAYSNYRGVFFAKPLVAFPLAVGAPPVDLPVKKRRKI